LPSTRGAPCICESTAVAFRGGGLSECKHHRYASTEAAEPGRLYFATGKEDTMNRNKRVDSAHTCDLNRREFLEVSAGAAALGMFGWPQSVAAQTGDAWNQGPARAPHSHRQPRTISDQGIVQGAADRHATSHRERQARRGCANRHPETFWRFDAVASAGDAMRVATHRCQWLTAL
jgi:hypothetical protein